MKGVLLCEMSMLDSQFKIIEKEPKTLIPTSPLLLSTISSRYNIRELTHA